MINPWKVGDRVRFAHQKKGEACFTVAAVDWLAWGPMVKIRELPGEFAAHVFVAADYPDGSIVPRPGRRP